MIMQKVDHLLSSTARKLAISHVIFTRSYFKKPFSYNDRYIGKFDYNDKEKYPRGVSSYIEEELLEEVHAIKALQIDQPSPFHIITRVRSMAGLPWHQKVTLRRLNLHSSSNGDCVIVPNSPQYNELIAKVKHVIRLKPAKFADGRVPTEKDIGALKVCTFTGTVRVDERLRLQSMRLNSGKPFLFQGNHLRGTINKIHGLSLNYPTV